MLRNLIKILLKCAKLKINIGKYRKLEFYFGRLSIGLVELPRKSSLSYWATEQRQLCPVAARKTTDLQRFLRVSVH